VLLSKQDGMHNDCAITNENESKATFDHEIPPNLPLPTRSRCLRQGGNMPLFGKEGRGEIFRLFGFTYALLRNYDHLQTVSTVNIEALITTLSKEAI